MKPHQTDLSPDQLRRMRQMSEDGIRQKDIARRFGITKSRVAVWLERAKKEAVK